MHVPSIPSRALHFVAVLGLWLVSAARADTVSWNVDTDGFWDVVSNWSSGQVPQPGDDVIIDRPGANVKVTHRSGTVAINTLTCNEAFVLSGGTLTIASTSALNDTFTFSAGTLGGAGTINVAGPLTWSGGTMNGSGTTNVNGGMQLTPASFVSINDTRVVNNAGAAVWTGSGSFSNSAGAQFNNLATGTLAIQTAADFISGTFGNAGRVTKVAGSGDGITRVTAKFNNTGSVTLSSGHLELDNGGTHTGRFTADPGAVLQFGGGTHALTGNGTISGAGTVLFAGGMTTIGGGTYAVTGATAVSAGTHTFNAGVTVSTVGALSISGGTVNFTSGGVINSSLYTQNGGTLNGSDTINVAGLLTWLGGTMSGSGITNANGGMQLDGAGSVTINDTRVVNNAGAATWTGAGGFGNGAAAQFNNLATGTFAIQTPADFIGGTFTNTGTVTKVAGFGDGDTRFAAVFNNNGVLTVTSGTLELDNGGTHSGSFTVDNGAVLQFGGGIHTFSGSTAISGDGMVQLAGGTTNFNAGTYNVAGMTTVSGGTHSFNAGTTTMLATLVLSGGTLSGNGAVNVAGPLAWSGGSMAGAGITNASGGMEITNPGTIFINEGRAVNNAGSATWTGTGNFGNASTAQLNNLVTGTFSIQTSADFLGGTFANAGTLVKGAGVGDGVTQISAGLANTGTVDVQGGTLNLTGGYTQTGGVTRLNGGALQSNAPLNINAGRLEGSGSVAANVASSGEVSPGLSPGMLTVTGSYTQASAGTVTIEIGGPTAGSQFDQLAISGAAVLNGTLALNVINGFAPSPGTSFQILTFGSHSGDFAAVSGLVIGNGLGFLKTVNATNVTLEVVQENCSDHFDNDGDGLTDCSDPKCSDVCNGTPTPTPTATLSATATNTTLPTATATLTLTPSPTLTRTSTATSTPKMGCVGDCGNDGEVTVDELILGVNIALGNVTLDHCPVFDTDGSGEVEINELIVGVNNALNGCRVEGAAVRPQPAARAGGRPA